MNTKKKLIAQLMILIIALGGVLLMSLKPSVLFGKSLTTRAGVVSGIEKAVEERNIADPHDPIVKDLKAYTYIAKFQLGGSPIVAKFQDPYQINEGDMLRVSGVQTEQFFDVLAYRNETLQHTGSNSWWMTALAGLIFALAAALIFFRVIQDPRWYEQGFFLLLFGVGVFLIFRGFYIKEAIDLLKQS
jgi:hypothetical protein